MAKSNAAFVKAWQLAKDPDRAARACGMKYLCALTRACRLRRLGVPLKIFRGDHSGKRAAWERVDVPALAKIAARYAPRGGSR